MNYYPNNFYQNYSYGNQYQASMPSVPAAALQGKVVDSVEMVKVNEVPFGGFGVFPKGDLSEVYIKSWNNNGTTQINTYRPVPVEETNEAKVVSANEELLAKIDSLNSKIDALMGHAEAGYNRDTKSVEPAPAKEMKVNAY